MLRREALGTLTAIVSGTVLNRPLPAFTTAPDVSELAEPFALAAQILSLHAGSLNPQLATHLHEASRLCRQAAAIRHTPAAGPAFWQSVCDSLRRIGELTGQGQLHFADQSPMPVAVSTASRQAESSLRQVLCS